MTKVSITGPRSQLQGVIEVLYDMRLLDLDRYEGELETGSPFEEAEELSEMLVDVRSLLSKLPEVEESEGGDFYLNELEGQVEDLKKHIETVEDEMSDAESRHKALENQREFFQKLEGTGVDYQDLKGTETLDVFIGELDCERFHGAVESGRYEIFEGRGASVVFYHEAIGEEVETALREADARQENIVDTDFRGAPGEILERLDGEREELQERLEGLKEERQKLADEWRGRLEDAESFLAEKVEKAEAPISFATTDRTFIAEGWIPEEEFNKLGERLVAATNNKVHLQTEQGENPPVKYDNGRLVKPFESLTDLVATPKYDEIDPSFMIFLTFPLVFGFMIGDAGYGLTSLIFFYAASKMFPAAKDIFNSLMYASVATIIFGLAFGDAFGFMIFGHHSELAAATGIHLFEKIPILFHRAEHLGEVFTIAAAFGLFHVNLGYLLGGYNEFVRHGIREAFLEKGSWLVLEIGAALWYFFGAAAGAPIVGLSIIMLYLGEGVEGVVEIPSLLSNVLSYLRIFGVAVAAVSLAAVVNAMAEPLFAMGGVTGIALGIFVLMVGHVFNTFIKIMEGFLQGIRLHYVELMTKFFEGGGRKYVPFGSK